MKANAVSDPNHKVTVRVLPGQVLRRTNYSLTNGQICRVREREAVWLERRGIAQRIDAA